MRLATWNCCCGPLERKLAAVNRLGAVSAYHKFYAEGHPVQWCGRLTRVSVGAYPDWRPLSDHMPLAVDFD